MTDGQFPEHARPLRLPDSKPLLVVKVAAFNGEWNKERAKNERKIRLAFLHRVINAFI